MSADCIGGKMLVTLAAPDQTHLSCPCCGATGLQRASVVNGHGVVPHHKVVPHRSAGVVAAAPQAHDLTPSEVALAKILAAWDAWPGSAQASEARDTVYDIRAPLAKRGMIGPITDDLSATGRALLDRAQRAGVL